MKKWTQILLSGLMAVSLGACSEAKEPIYTAGTYSASETGFGGDITVTITVDEYSIKTVEIVGDNETEGVGSKAVEELGKVIVDAQSAEVDGVSGATISSTAIKAAAASAIAQAKGEAEPVGTLSMTDGTYTGTGTGVGGALTADVTIKDNAITDIQITEHNETLAIGYGVPTAPIETLPEKIIAAQSLSVDFVSGATITSSAIAGAVADAVTQAGGDANILWETPVETQAVEQTEYEADIVVVGAGVAGLSAAVEAAQQGATVVVLEKEGIPGGSTSRSGGKILAAGTSLQEAQGIEDNAEMLEAYFEEVGNGQIDTAKTTAFAQASADQVEWLLENGWQAGEVERTHSSIETWRVHNSKDGYWMISGNGGWFTVALEEAAEKAGVTLVYDTPATDLIVEDGKVTGVKAEAKDGSEVTVRAQSVILATGGYAANMQMVMEQYPDIFPQYAFSNAGSGTVGDALKMVEAVNGDVVVAPTALVTYVSFTCGAGINEEAGLIVDPLGERVCNEFSYQYHLTAALAEKDAPYCWYIADADDPNQSIQYGMTLEDTVHADSVEELAELIGADPAVLEETIVKYNAACDSGVDEEFGKPAEYLNKLEGTLYAIQYNPTVAATFGGINTDLSSRVLDQDGQVVEGLYAAGEVAFVGMTGLEYPSCGTAIGYGVYSGRTAADDAVAKLNK